MKHNLTPEMLAKVAAVLPELVAMNMEEMSDGITRERDAAISRRRDSLMRSEGWLPVAIADTMAELLVHLVGDRPPQLMEVTDTIFELRHALTYNIRVGE